MLTADWMQCCRDEVGAMDRSTARVKALLQDLQCDSDWLQQQVVQWTLRDIKVAHDVQKPFASKVMWIPFGMLCASRTAE